MIFPGFADAWDDMRVSAWQHRRRHRGLANRYTVHLVGRRRGLPHGITTAEMAVDYAEAVRGIGGPVHLLGYSVGGCAALHLAADHPELVDRLVLVNAAHRVSEEGRSVAERWIDLASRGSWLEVYFGPSNDARIGLRKVWGELLIRYLGRHLVAFPRDPADFVRSVEACLCHDASDSLDDVAAPTLVIARGNDPLFPEGVLREAVGRLTDAAFQAVEPRTRGFTAGTEEGLDQAILGFLPSGGRRWSFG